MKKVKPTSGKSPTPISVGIAKRVRSVQETRIHDYLTSDLAPPPITIPSKIEITGFWIFMKLIIPESIFFFKEFFGIH